MTIRTLAILFSLLLASTATAQLRTIDFEDQLAHPLAPNDVVTEVYSADGTGPVFISLSCDTPNHPDCWDVLEQPRIFDTANPTCFDTDLGTPNSDFGGPGIGPGGWLGAPYQNDTQQFQALIAQGRPPGEEPICTPNDAGAYNIGTALNFDFADTGPVHIVSITVVDVDNQNTVIRLLNPDGDQIGSLIPVPQTGHNGVVVFPVDVHNVGSMSVILNESGAVDDVVFQIPELEVLPQTLELQPGKRHQYGRGKHEGHDHSLHGKDKH